MQVGHVALCAGAHRHPSGATKARRTSCAGPCPPVLILFFFPKSALPEISDQCNISSPADT